MQIRIILAIATVAWLSPSIGGEGTYATMPKGEDPIYIERPSAETDFIALCDEIEEEKAKACASACAATGRTHSYESALCGIGSSCKCT